jgi:hypothetical protein
MVFACQQAVSLSFGLHDNIVGQAALLADATPNVPLGDPHSHAAKSE